MPIFLLDASPVFPDPSLADAETGILAVGGDLSPRRLVAAYRQGIFPWYDEATCPILWHAPSLRFVLEPSALHVSRSLEKTLRRAPFRLTYDAAFADVLNACAEVPRPGQAGTWLNDQMKRAYGELHRRGVAHSAEAWEGERLVGGLYGVTLGGVFFGESMFARATDASKVAFVTLVRHLGALGYTLIDCQVRTEHLARFGAVDWPRERFHEALARALRIQPRCVWPGDDQGSAP